MKDSPMKTSAFRQGLLATNAAKKENLGCIRITDDGRTFRYAKAGATALAAGKATAAAAIVAAHIDGAIASGNNPINNTQLTITVTAGTAIADGELNNGYLQVNDGLLEGRQYRIESNSALTAAGTSITVSLADPIAGYDSTTLVTLARNPFYGTIISATPESFPTGIAPVAVPADHYYWSQTGGPACALCTGTPAVGTMLTHGAADGSLGAINATLDIDQPIVAIAWGIVGVDTDYKPVFLKID